MTIIMTGPDMSAMLEQHGRLLEALPGDRATGIDPRLDDSPLSSFRQVKDAREEARRLERQAEIDGEGQAQALPFWRTVLQKGQELLEEQAKDLEICAYLIEALIRLDGFRGLAEGFEMARQLTDRFWGELYPEPDEDGIETTLLPLSRMNGDVLVDAIKRVPITQGTSMGPFRIWQHRQAQDLNQFSAEEQEERIQRGAVSLAMFERAVAETPAEFFQGTWDDLQAAETAVRSLEETLNERAGLQAPLFSRVHDALEDSLAVLRQIADRHLSKNFTESEPQAAGAPVSTERSNASVSLDGIPNRDAAFSLLLKVAEFFERAEPQSIIPAEIRKTVRRGRMSPEELYRDLISDNAVLEQMFRDVGIQTRDAQE
jgi:type VI secretion system protein ImpA